MTLAVVLLNVGSTSPTRSRRARPRGLRDPSGGVVSEQGGGHLGAALAGTSSVSSFGTNGILSTMPDQATDDAGSESSEASACCGVTACCSHDEAATEPGVTVTEAKTAAGCGCVA